MKMVNNFEFFAIVPEIPSPKHHEIQEFAKNYHISAMKINKMFVFSSPELKAQVSYSDRLLSVVRLSVCL
jgi:hypothetical protein